MKLNNFTLIGLLICFLSIAAFAGDFNAQSTTGIIQAWDGVYAPEGSRVELIWAGPDSTINPPNANGVDLDFGDPTGDDQLIRQTRVGNGYLPGMAEGRFDKDFSHSLITAGALVYLRVWNVDTPDDEEDSYGDSDIYIVQTALLTESHDFGSVQIDMYADGRTHPVELANFGVTATAGRNTVTWSTMSESENLGFHVYRADSPDGERVQLTQELISGAINSEIRHDYNYEDKSMEDGVKYYYWIADVATDGTIKFHGPVSAISIAAPTFYALEQNYPNPFNPSTTINFKLKEDGRVRLMVYNLRGQVVNELMDQTKMAGEYAVEWRGMDNSGMRVPSGLYFYTIEVNDFKATRKMALTK